MPAEGDMPVKKGAGSKGKLYMLDTNVLLLHPQTIFSFESGTIVGIPAVVLEELDNFKKEGTDRGRGTREVIRYLDDLRQQGSLSKGVTLDNGSIVRIYFLSHEPSVIPFRLDAGDNEILLIALEAQQEGYDVTFLSKDLNARVKADAIGLHADDYKKEFVTESDFYRGWTRVPVPAVELKKDLSPEVERIAKEGDLETNEYVLLESQHNPHNYQIQRYLGGERFKKVMPPKFKWNLAARNSQQSMALDALMDDDIQFVTLFGPAGTGKTFLALLAGLHKVLVEDTYQKIFVSRPVVPLGRDIGYLPGDIKEKLHSWMLPIYDNMELIMHTANIGDHLEVVEEENGDYRDDRRHGRGDRHGRRRDDRRRGGRGGRHGRGQRSRIGTIEDLEMRGKISMEAITYMRGRSIPYQYILIDEAQNLTSHEVKTIVSRAGEGSKVVLVGDPHQIDSPFLDFSSNGLVTCSQTFKGQKLFATVYLETSERSELSKLVTELL